MQKKNSIDEKEIEVKNELNNKDKKNEIFLVFNSIDSNSSFEGYNFNLNLSINECFSNYKNISLN